MEMTQAIENLPEVMALRVEFKSRFIWEVCEVMESKNRHYQLKPSPKAFPSLP